MINLAKGLLSLAIGVGGIGGIVYEVTTSSNTQKEGLNVTDPVLVCGDGYSHWKVLLKKAKDTENNLGEGITFSIQTKSGKNIPWGNKAKRSNDWADWRLNFQGKDLKELWFREPETREYHVTYLLSKCESSQIELIDPAKNQQEKEGIVATTIRFKVDKSSCKNPTTEGCSIQFDPATNLKWKEEFKPTITFSN
ncbi:hypothetical protein DNK47_02755 [Mycoplasma wenyonii]|uniref:Uncharacterized protein n=1 Tax=Mycoplasma wenyonii TaxID=65123 RepID=A0A328PIG5_9MOLU|nr:hypothetical protein [Mycoplasma wenyonii]RAO94863.1 hypothetical protein DNK47_02755 [Mycoplasma wenyonii]